MTTNPGEPALVSVIIPVYNHAVYVATCLQSVADQDYGAIELVAIDDGSADDSASVVEEFLSRHQARFRRIDFHRRENRGLTATLDQLMERATGEIVVPLASDDALLPGSITRRVELLQSRPDMLAVASDCTVVDEHGRVTHQSGIRDLHHGHPAALRYTPRLATTMLLNWSIPGPCISFRRTAMEPATGIGPYADLSFPEDLDLYVRLAAAGVLWFVPEQLALYRLHSTNISQVQTELMHIGNREAIERLVPRLRPADRAVARCILVATSDHRGRRTIARAALWLARRAWPPVAATLGGIPARRRTEPRA